MGKLRSGTTQRVEGFGFFKGFSFYTGRYRTREDTDGHGPELREKSVLHDRLRNC